MSEYNSPWLVVTFTFDTKTKVPNNIQSFEEYFTHPLDGVLCKIFPDLPIGSVIGMYKPEITFRARLKTSEYASKKFRAEFTYKALNEVSKVINRPSTLISKRFTLYNTISPDIIADRVDEEIFGHYTYEKDISLLGIHKNIKSANTFVVDEPGNIIKGGLGLLLIKDLDSLSLYRSSIKKAEWFNIILKHFNGDKDVLECQEELIENGFKEYARL